MGQQATGQKIVLVGSTRMGHDGLDCHTVEEIQGIKIVC